MSERSDPSPQSSALRDQIIGLGSRSLRKSFYPQLQQQIDELKAARQKAEEDEQKFRTLFNEITDGVVVADLETRHLIKVNPAFCQMLGYTEEELLKLTIPEIHPREEWQEMTEDLKELVEHTSVLVKDRIFSRKDGSVFYADINATTINLENRRCALGVCRDITENKRAEDRLRASEAKFRIVANNTYDWEFWMNPEGQMLYTSPSCLRITGHTAQEFQDDPELIYKIIHPDDQPAVREHNFLVSHSKISGEIEFRILRPNGIERWISHACQPVFSETGEYLGVRGSNRDITTNKQTELALRASETRFKNMFNQAPLGIAVVDSLNARFYAVNPMFAKIAGRTVEEMMQIDWTSITHPDDLQADLNKMAAMNAGKTTGFQMEKRYRHPDDSYVWINMTVATMDVEDKAHPRHLLMIEEITERKQMEEGLKSAIVSTQRAKEAAEIANRAKDEFIAVLSHELRTPLTPVLATVSAFLEQDEMPVSIRSDMELICRNVEMEAALIDDLLDVTRISRGKIALQQETLNIHDCLRTTLEICQDEITSKCLEMQLEFHAAQHHVWADPARLRQVFWNLLKNAVKFTHRGGRITLRTHNVGDRVQIEFSDTGIGIAPEIQPIIFNIFEQGEQSRIRQFGGLGLGLHIAQAVVKLHEGRLTAFSEGKNKGATFTVELATVPPPQGNPVLPTPTAEPEKGALRILLVEDHLDSMLCLIKLLERSGHTVTTAENVRTALELAEGHEFDLLISDLGLPDGSGLDVMRHVKEHSGIPGIALSGFGAEEDIRQSRAAGFADHLTKPINIAALRTAIQQLAHPSS